MRTHLRTLLTWLLVLPTAALLVWIERQGSLPFITNRMGWPIFFVEGNLDEAALLDCVLLAACVGFGIFSDAKKWSRIRFLGGNAVIALFFFTLWQPTGIVVWSWINHPVLAQLTSFGAFWLFFYLGFRIRREHLLNPAHPNQDLIYFALSLVTTPWLSLDRMLMIGAFTAWAAYEIRKRRSASLPFA